MKKIHLFRKMILLYKILIIGCVINELGYVFYGLTGTVAATAVVTVEPSLPTELVEEWGCYDTEIRLTCSRLDSTIAILEATFTPNCTGLNDTECTDLKRFTRAYTSPYSNHHDRLTETEAGRSFLQILQRSHESKHLAIVEEMARPHTNITRNIEVDQKTKRDLLRTTLEHLIVEYLRELSPESMMEEDYHHHQHHERWGKRKRRRRRRKRAKKLSSALAAENNSSYDDKDDLDNAEGDGDLEDIGSEYDDEDGSSSSSSSSIINSASDSKNEDGDDDDNDSNDYERATIDKDGDYTDDVVIGNVGMENCADRRRQIRKFDQFELDKTMANELEQEHNIRRVLNYRCAGKNHCSFVFADDYPFSILWKTGIVRIKYICMKEFLLNKFCQEHLVIGNGHPPPRQPPTIEEYQEDEYNESDEDLDEQPMGEPKAEARIQNIENFHHLKILTKSPTEENIMEPPVPILEQEIQPKSNQTNRRKNQRIYSQDFRQLKIIPSHTIKNIKKIGDEQIFKLDEQSNTVYGKIQIPLEKNDPNDELFESQNEIFDRDEIIDNDQYRYHQQKSQQTNILVDSKVYRPIISPENTATTITTTPQTPRTTSKNTEAIDWEEQNFINGTTAKISIESDATNEINESHTSELNVQPTMIAAIENTKSEFVDVQLITQTLMDKFIFETDNDTETTIFTSPIWTSTTLTAAPPSSSTPKTTTTEMSEIDNDNKNGNNTEDFNIYNSTHEPRTVIGNNVDVISSSSNNNYKNNNNNNNNKYDGEQHLQLHLSNNLRFTTIRTPQPQGFIATTGYPKYYVGDSDCRWKITAPHGHKVRLTILDLNLRYDSKCKDYLQILDVSFGQILYQSCTEIAKPIQIVSESNELEVMVRTTSKLAYPKRGVLLHYTALGCLAPSSPQYGRLVHTTENTAKYICDPSYVFPDTAVSSRELICSLRYTWDKTLPDCIERKTITPLPENLHIVSFNHSKRIHTMTDKQANMIYDVAIPSIIIAALFIGNAIVFMIIMRYRNKRKQNMEFNHQELAQL